MSKPKSARDNELIRTIKELLVTLEKTQDHSNEELTKAAALKVDDIYLPLNHLFSQATKHAFQNQVKCLKVRRKINVITTTQVEAEDQIRYFGAKAIGERHIFDAAKLVSDTINSLSAEGYISGVLVKLSALPLATEPFQLPQYMVFCFPLMTPEGYELVDRVGPGMFSGTLYPVDGMPTAVCK